MPIDLLQLGAALGAALAFALGWIGLRLWRRPRGLLRLSAGGVGLLAGLVCAALAALALGLAAGLTGYRALTHEELAVTVHTRPLGERRFEARFVFPDGAESVYTLAGDQLVVEARILKWHAWANWLGLHTAYELDRVAGRYERLADEQQLPRTVHALGPEREIDLFAMRRQLPWLAPFVDAEYGSGTFTGARRAASWELRVSTTGLLVRERS